MEVFIRYSYGISTIHHELKFQEIDEEETLDDFKNRVIEVLDCAIEREDNKLITK